jgi:phosphopantothenoylcysteine decarboxylase/phosphopantothenate--cysteine ligase
MRVLKEMSLQGKKILLGITGGIAAYKCAELVRIWIRAGAEVKVIMTAAAQKFITPLTFETLTVNRVFTSLFPEERNDKAIHIGLADWTDVLVIAPATANFLAKARMGMGDDLLSTVSLAAWYKTMIFPAMNSNMWKNPAVRENIDELKKRGYLVINPDEGDLACGYTGPGRLADSRIIEYWVQYFLSPKTILKDKTILITAGRTEEEIDPVRILTNRSSGKMGFALAREAYYRGARVILISGPNSLFQAPGIEYYGIISAREMEKCVSSHVDQADIVISTAAVTDYRCKSIAAHKIKREDDNLKMELIANPDILYGLSQNKKNKILIGFALETENMEKNTLMKMHDKNLDMIVVNNPLDKGAAFSHDTNKVIIYCKKNKKIELPLLKKTEVAGKILDEIEKIIK